MLENRHLLMRLIVYKLSWVHIADASDTVTDTFADTDYYISYFMF